MALINNGFILGALAISVMYGIHVAYSLLCIIYRIRILEFSFFFAPFFKLHHRVINGVAFSLGWLPLGGYVKPLGYQGTEEEMNEVKPEDRPYAAFSKPKYLKLVFFLIPFIVTFAAILTALSVFKDSSIASSVTEIYNYIAMAARAIFTKHVSDQDFAALTLATTEGSNMIAFTLILILVVLCFSHILNILMLGLTSTGEEARGVKMVAVMACYLAFLWVFLWKVPAFILSFVPFSQALVSLASFMLGALVTGVVLYFSTILVAMFFPGRAATSVKVLQENEQN